MKHKLIILLILLARISCPAQSPQSFKYQTVLRDHTGILLNDKAIKIRIGILKTETSGSTVYLETHQVQSNKFGIADLEIGTGQPDAGSFTSINWGDDKYFIKAEIDLGDGDGFEVMGISQLLSVPYSLFSTKSGDGYWQKQLNDISYSNGKVGIGTTSPIVKLEINGNSDLNLLNLRNQSNSLGVNMYVSSNTDFHGSALIGRRSRGTYLMPQPVLEGDRISGIYGSIFANNDYQNSSAIHFYVGANPGTNSYPSNIRFETTGTNQTTRLERMRITESGDIRIKSGDIFLENINAGVIMKSPNGQCWRMTVDNSGNPVFTTISCP